MISNRIEYYLNDGGKIPHEDDALARMFVAEDNLLEILAERERIHPDIAKINLNFVAVHAQHRRIINASNPQVMEGRDNYLFPVLPPIH